MRNNIHNDCTFGLCGDSYYNRKGKTMKISVKRICIELLFVVN